MAQKEDDLKAMREEKQQWDQRDQEIHHNFVKVSFPPPLFLEQKFKKGWKASFKKLVIIFFYIINDKKS